jgi:HK97 gp10 family phage protein
MSSPVEFDLKGFDAIIERMKKLPAELRGKAGRSALGSAAAIVRKKAKENALRIDDIETGRKIADNIVQRVRTRYTRQTGDLKVSVGVGTERGRIPKGNPDEGPRGGTPHWHLVELGTERVQEQPFMRPALESSAEQVVATFADKLSKQLDKVTR